VPELPDLDHLSRAEKDAPIRALCQRLEAVQRRIAEREARLADPGKTPEKPSMRRRKARRRTDRRRPGAPRRAEAVWAAKAAALRWPGIPTKQ
jgi:hypothetical protein